MLVVMDYAVPPTEQQRWRRSPEGAPLAEPLDDSADSGDQARAALALLHAAH